MLALKAFERYPLPVWSCLRARGRYFVLSASFLFSPS
jgi:hypothetical protein